MSSPSNKVYKSNSIRFSIILEDSENEESVEESPDGPLELPLEDYETEFYNIELAHEAINELLVGLTRELSFEDQSSDEQG